MFNLAFNIHQTFLNIIYIPIYCIFLTRQRVPGPPEERSTNRPEQEEVQTEKWDVFRENVDDDEALSCKGCGEFSKRLLKVIFIIVSFGMILTSLVVSKMCILLIVSNLVNSDGVLQFTAVTNRTCLLPNVNREPFEQGEAFCGIPACNNTMRETSDYPAPHPGVRWTWALFLCMATPYAVVILRCLRQMLFKKKKNPTLKPTIMVRICTSIDIKVREMLKFRDNRMNSNILISLY